MCRYHVEFIHRGEWLNYYKQRSLAEALRIQLHIEYGKGIPCRVVAHY